MLPPSNTSVPQLVPRPVCQRPCLWGDTVNGPRDRPNPDAARSGICRSGHCRGRGAWSCPVGSRARAEARPGSNRAWGCSWRGGRLVGIPWPWPMPPRTCSLSVRRPSIRSPCRKTGSGSARCCRIGSPPRGLGVEVRGNRIPLQDPSAADLHTGAQSLPSSRESHLQPESAAWFAEVIACGAIGFATPTLQLAPLHPGRCHVKH